jgi:predicted DNA-binding transcriptional regulator AlpA
MLVEPDAKTNTEINSLALAATNDNFMSSDDAANLLGLSPRTLERFRLEGRGPKFFKFGRVVRYRRSMTLDWAAAQLRTSTSDPGLAA